MSLITAIAPTPRHAGRFDIMVDGVAMATLSLDVIERLELRVGRDIAGLEEGIAAEGAQLKVSDRALNMLAFRARSSAELARTLVRKGEDKSMVDRAIARLQEQGLLDDAAFARSFTRARVVGAQQSRRRVQQELARRGVARAVVDDAIATVFEQEEVDQADVVVQAARRKLRTMIKLDPAVRRRRLYGFLARRGYDGEDIRRAMATVGDELRVEEQVEE